MMSRRSRGVLSLDASVKHYLMMRGAQPCIEIDFGTTRKICRDVLEVIQPLASKRGRKEDVIFYLFMQALYDLAQESGARITLPSRQSKGRDGSPDRSPFFHFVRGALELAIVKGRPAIEHAELPDPEKQEALRQLAHSNKGDDGILEYLYRVRNAAAARRNRTSRKNKVSIEPGGAADPAA
jgi:hypothetical protein